METIKKTDKIFKWIILGIAIAHIITYLMPIYKSVYTYRDDTPEIELIYFYTNSSSLYLSYYFAYATSYFCL